MEATRVREAGTRESRSRSLRLREWVKANLPAPAKRLVSSVREAMAAPALEDITLHPYRLVADPDPRPRLNLVIPTLDPAQIFGGVMTGLDLLFNLAQRCDLDVRIVGDRVGDAIDRGVVDRAAAGRAFTRNVEIRARDQWDPELPVRKRDVFISFNWWTTLNLRPVMIEQARLFDRPALPLIYLLQEFEPAFYELSSTHMHAMDALNDQRQICILNSSQLAGYMDTLGVGPRERYIIEPVMATELRAHWDRPANRSRRLLAYGRPQIPRNCFPALTKGLQWWAQHYPDAGRWTVVSAGTPHPPIRLSDGQVMQSLGKLSMDGYAAELSSCAVGVSLMASPHPSYPPLEMANFGMLAITNAYPGKSPAELHPNVIGIEGIGPEQIGEALVRACEQFEAEGDAAGDIARGGSPFLDMDRNERVYAALATRIQGLTD